MARRPCAGSTPLARAFGAVRGLGPASAAAALLAAVALAALTRGAAEIPSEVVLQILLGRLR